MNQIIRSDVVWENNPFDIEKRNDLERASAKLDFKILFFFYIFLCIFDINLHINLWEIKSFNNS